MAARAGWLVYSTTTRSKVFGSAGGRELVNGTLFPYNLSLLHHVCI